MSISLGRKLIKSLNGKHYPLKRKNGAYQNGYWVESPDASQVTIFASVQPLTGREMERIPEGDRARERKKLYSADLVLVGDDATRKPADVITIDGEDYQAEKSEKWTDYWKVVVVKVEPAEETS